MTDITFEKSAADFVREAFPDIENRCGICGDCIDRNLGGVVVIENKAHFICTKKSCVIALASKPVN